MDQLVSNIIPTHRIGHDGFNWWVGQIEGTAADESNNKGGYRFKVRIVGDHPGDPELVGTEDLPWASVMMPVNVPFIPGNGGGAHPQLEIGCWVIGFYMDTEKQKPIIMGSIGQTPGATKVFTERTPETPPFTTAIPQINAQADGPPLQKGTDKNTATGGLSDGTTDGDGNARVTTPAKKVEPLKNKTATAEDWCQSKAEKCDENDMSSQLTGIMGEFLAAVQNNGGNIGTYVVNEATGGLMDGINIARGYVNKIMKVVSEFVARVKGFVIEKLKAAVDDLIKALLRPSEDGNSLTPVTEFFNNLLKDLGCSMADLGDRLSKWLTDVLMSYVQQIYKSVACQVDALVNGIMSKINSLMDDLLNSVLGPISDILGAIAGPLNILGGAINQVLNLLGISCSGPDRSCSKKKQICTNGSENQEKESDFLDQLLEDIDNLFPATGADYTQYVCDDAYGGNSLEFTTVGFTGGVQKGGSASDEGGNGSGGIPDLKDQDPDNDGVKQTKRITYTINDVTVEEGETAGFVVTRTGFTEVSSSVKYKTLKYNGNATEGEDYLPESGILGFAPGETQKTIRVVTLTDSIREKDEQFKVRITKNTPKKGSVVQTRFIKTIGTATITERNVVEPYNPWSGPGTNPGYGLDELFDDDLTGPTDDDGDGDTTGPDVNDGPFTDDDGDGKDDTTGRDITRTVNVVADRNECPEGEFIVYTVTTENYRNGEILYYTLSGNGITSEDIIGGNLVGNIVVNDNTSKITVGIEDDGVVEDAEILRLTINGTGAFADVIITTPDDLDDDDGDGEGPKTDTDEFVPPTVITEEIITDENGGIIDIPVSNPGSPWAEPPYVFITGNGIGATATALLDRDGFLTEIRIKSNGFGYRKNLASDNDKRCIIDAFTVIRPGIGYTEPPTIYVNGRTDVAEAIINDDGFLIGAKVLDRITTYEKYPEILVIGGNGYGAKLLPSLACLDTDALVKVGSTKIGTGRYVDCP